MARFKLAAPIKRSSRRAGGATHLTIKEFEITRGRDRAWQGRDDVFYLSFYTTHTHADKQQATAEIAMSYADARTLVRALREQLRLERAYHLRAKAAAQEAR